MIANKKEKAAINNGIGWLEPPIPLFMAAFRRKRKFTFTLFIKLLFLLLFCVFMSKQSHADPLVDACKGKKEGHQFFGYPTNYVYICRGGRAQVYSDVGSASCNLDKKTCRVSYPEGDKNNTGGSSSGGGSSGGSSSGGGSSGGSSSGGSSSGGSSSGGGSSGGSLEIVDIGDSKPPKKQDGQNEGGKNGKQEGEIGPVGGWAKEPEKKAPKGQLYKVTLGCYAGEDCDFEKYAEDLNDACSGSVSSGKHITNGYSYRLFVRNGVCYYEASNDGRRVNEVPADAKLVSSDKVPEDKKPKDKKKDEKPKDDKGKECLDNNPHICKGKDGKWEDTREDGKPKEQQKPEDKGVFKDKDGVYRSEDDGGEVYKDKDGTWRQKEGKNGKEGKDGKEGNDGQNGRDGRNAEGKDYGGILNDIKQSIDNVNKNIVDGFKGMKEGRGKGDGSSSGDKKGDGKAEEGYQGNPEWDKLNGMGHAEFTKGRKFSEAGYCPAPVQFNISIMGKSMNLSFSYEWICDVAKKLRPVVVAFAYCIASAVCLRGLSSS